MGLFDSKQKQSSTSSTSAPSWIQPYLTQSAANYGSMATPEAFGGDWQAALNPMQAGAWNNMYNNAAGNQYQDQMAGFGGQAMDSMSRMMANPNGAFNYNQGVFDQTMGNLMPALQGSYDAATRDNNRQLNWSTLPGLDMGAAAAGQQGGTKLGQQSALATAMTGDRNADIGASMYQNAVNQASQNAMQSGSQNLNAQMSMYGMGANALNNAYSMNTGNLGLQNQAGAGYQGYNQAGIDYDRMQFDQQQTNPWLYEGQRLGALGNVGQAFGTTNTNAVSSGSPGIGNIGLQLGSAWLGGGGNPFSGMMGGGGGMTPFQQSVSAPSWASGNGYW